MNSFILNSRKFNSVTLNNEKGYVSKTSSNPDILIDEINWYRSIPESIKKYTPQLLNFSTKKSAPYLNTSYLPFPTLSYYLLNQPEDDLLWERIFSQIENLFNDFARFLGNLSHEDIRRMYITKTETRVELFLDQNHLARKMYSKKFYTLNGKVRKNPFVTFEENKGVIEKIINKAKIRLIHGDLCFSNIFFDIATDQLYIVDPRGDFGKKGIFGDVRYDLAKIRHSLSGYERIINNEFSIQCSEGEINYLLLKEKEERKLQYYWDIFTGNSIAEVKLIEALLYLSMLPLHYEDFSRQMILYALGTELLDNALEMGG
ncbi:hypothetical protein [Bacillus sp. 166amftsu]|uniref:hypothetical protein n=1 Tax=Bacillus sp. 166amftsu TaxID=1761753 RepID=UPI000896BEF8|nr:hypothetical protein [Bacillus sp. 166amftsu]SDZ37732.1 hypothetical protein SAMN04488156_12224 [Bacillus sp. 166amftsu]